MSFNNERGETYYFKSTSPRPQNPSINSILIETDTEDQYRYNKYNRWELIPPISLKSKRIQTLFTPFTNQTGLIFGEGSWKGIFAEIHNSGNMVYSTRTSASTHDLGIASDPNHTYGHMTVFDLANVNMLPKMQMIFSFSDAVAGNSVAFIGLKKDSDVIADTTATFMPSGVSAIGLGYGLADTTYQIYHNDASGAVNVIDTTIARDINVYMIEIEYQTAVDCRLSLFDIDMELVFEDVYSTEIPGSGIDLGFTAKIQNANHVARYGINMYDYIRLEKERPPLSATIDP